jgi:hypothetical protein
MRGEELVKGPKSSIKIPLIPTEKPGTQKPTMTSPENSNFLAFPPKPTSKKFSLTF